MTIKELWKKLAKDAGIKEKYPSNEKIAKAWRIIALESQQRYESLLVLLPQNSFSFSDTKPELIADAVERNTFNKLITQDDVKMMINETEDFEDLKNKLIKYFELSEDNQ